MRVIKLSVENGDAGSFHTSVNENIFR